MGKCDFDLNKIELKPECEGFCEKIGPCWEDEGEREEAAGEMAQSSGKEDTITDGSDMVQECKVMCSIFLADPEYSPSMTAAIDCLADAEGDCAELEGSCQDELAAAFGSEHQSAGGVDASGMTEDVVSDKKKNCN